MAFFTLQPHESFLAAAGAGEAGAEVFTVGVAPAMRPSTSATTSRIKVSFTALIKFNHEWTPINTNQRTIRSHSSFGFLKFKITPTRSFVLRK